MNIKPPTIYSSCARSKTKKKIVYNDSMIALAVDLKKSDIQSNCLENAPQCVKNVYDLVVFTQRMFYCKNFKSHMYLIQKDGLVPKKLSSSDMVMGYVVVVLIEERAFANHFPTVGKCVMALNNGYISADAALKLEFVELEDALKDFDMRSGIGKAGRLRNPTYTVGDMTTLSRIDMSVEMYHYTCSLFVEDVRGKDLEEAWVARAELLSPKYLFEKSKRSSENYVELLRLCKMIRGRRDVGGEIHMDKVTLDVLRRHRNDIQGDDMLSQMFQSHLEFYDWEKMFFQEGDHYTLDLTKRVAWKVEQQHLHNMNYFYSNPFYIIPPRGVLDDIDCERDNEDVEDEEMAFLENIMPQYANNSHMLEALVPKEPPLYPTMEHVKGMFQSFAEELSNGQMCSLYLSESTGPFLVGVYNDFMKSNKLPMSSSRRMQYKNVRYLQKSTFPHNCLNAAQDRITGEYQLHFAEMFSEVDSFQGMLASQLLNMAISTNICHLSAELYIFLLSNIISFTPKKCKPLLVLDGPTAAGKSFTTSALQQLAIGVGKAENKFACKGEHYATTRSQTLSSLDPYDNVLGQKIVEEWQSGEGRNNVFHSNTSLESVTMKNVYDHGVTSNQRGMPTKTQTGEKCIKSTDYALDDRSVILLANGFSVCSSLKNRCTIFRIPDLTARVFPKDEKSIIEDLQAQHIPQFFCMMRYLISEEYNRQWMNMSVKFMDREEEMDVCEEHLTFERIQQVMDEMGFVTKEVLTNRKRSVIQYMAQVIAHWRAVGEVYAGVHPDCNMRQPKAEETLQTYNSFLVKKMTSHLKGLSEFELLQRQSSRYVVDPADILSATTLVLQFTEPDRQLLHVICAHLAEPGDFCDLDNWRDDYLLIEHINENIICEELKKQRTKVLDESIGELLTKLEQKTIDTQNGRRIPCVRQKKEESNAFNKTKENKRYQLFTLYINAEFAAQLYAQEEVVKIESCIQLLSTHLMDIVTGNRQCVWNKTAGRLGVSTFYLKLQIPDDLMKTFQFLYHLPGQRKLVASTCFEKDAGKYVCEICPDFGKARLRVLQKLVLEKMTSSSDGFFGTDGYMKLDGMTNTVVFDKQAVDMVKTQCQCWEDSPMLVREFNGKWHVHVQIFDVKFKSNVDVQKWCSVVRQKCLQKEQFARRGYFVLPSKEITDLSGIEMRSDIDTHLGKPLFVRNRENNTVSVHISILEEIRVLDGVVKQKANQARTLVEKCLCKNMTDFPTVMLFDRERVYKSQSVFDSISFVNVQDVAFQHHNGVLPTFESESLNQKQSDYREQSGTTKLATFVKQLNKCKTSSGCMTFHPHHRQRKLALKHILTCSKEKQLKSDLMQMVKDGKQADNNNAVFQQFSETIDRLSGIVSDMYRPLRKTVKLQAYPDAMKQDGKNCKPAEEFASSVYTRDFSGRCCVTKTKRKADNDTVIDCESRPIKRIK